MPFVSTSCILWVCWACMLVQQLKSSLVFHLLSWTFLRRQSYVCVSNLSVLLHVPFPCHIAFSSISTLWPAMGKLTFSSSLCCGDVGQNTQYFTIKYKFRLYVNSLARVKEVVLYPSRQSSYKWLSMFFFPTSIIFIWRIFFFGFAMLLRNSRVHWL